MTAFVVTWIFSPSFSEKAHLPAPLKNGLDSVQSDVFKGFSGTSRKMMTFLLCFRRSLIVSSSRTPELLSDHFHFCGSSINMVC